MLIFPFFVHEPIKFFTFDSYYGAFGWMNDSYAFFLVAIINAPITGIIGNLGFYYAYFYWPMQIVAGTMLIEPFLAQIAGIVLGQDEVPGIKTLVGCIIITLGFIVAGFGARYKTINRKYRRDSIYGSDMEYTKIEDK